MCLQSSKDGGVFALPSCVFMAVSVTMPRWACRARKKCFFYGLGLVDVLVYPSKGTVVLSRVISLGFKLFCSVQDDRLGLELVYEEQTRVAFLRFKLKWKTPIIFYRH